MPHTLLRILLLPALVAACGRTETAAGTVGRKPDAAAASTPVAAAANSTAPTGSGLRDSISDRADRGRIFGDTTAQVWLVMASDFQCPFCKQWHDASFSAIMQDYVAKGRVRLAFLNYPLGQHQNAIPAAEAAMCASVQGKFWPMHEALFASQPKWETATTAVATFDSLAAATGLNMALYRECVSKHLTLPLIQADHDRAANAGVRSTPTFNVGDKVMMGADQNVKAALDAALAKAGAKKPAN
jgi:protein-disulfide isomerase